MAFIDKDDLKVEMSITGSSDDTLLEALATAVLSLWDELTNMTWAEAEHTEYKDSPKNSSSVILDNYPVTSEASITLYDDPDWEFGSDTLIAASEYACDLNRGIIYYDGVFNKGNQSIKVVYTAGYNDGNVPSWLKQNLVRQASFWFKQAKNQQWAVSSVTFPGDSGVISFKQLKDNLLPDFVLLADKYRG